jgi:small subunit ribosomal protein S4
MGRYLGPTCRLSRREKQDLDLKSGIKPIKNKCKIGLIPGGLSSKQSSTQTTYGMQLRNKQKTKRFYGMQEKQFRRFYDNAIKQSGNAGINFLHILESRLDNVVYRLGFATTRAEARQIVSHKAILVNGQLCNIPSYIVQVADVIEVREKAKKQERILKACQFSQNKELCSWVEVDYNELKGTFAALPDPALHTQFDIQSIIEFYAK